jgi:hypothetical protein
VGPGVRFEPEIAAEFREMLSRRATGGQSGQKYQDDAVAAVVQFR